MMYIFYIIFTLIELFSFTLNINILNIVYLFIEYLFKPIFCIYINKIIILTDLISI